MKEVLTTDIKEFPLSWRGKVRDIYDLGDRLLFIATDRVSAFDVVMPNGIPGRGKVLTAISIFWFDFLKDVGFPGQYPYTAGKYASLPPGAAPAVGGGHSPAGGGLVRAGRYSG